MHRNILLILDGTDGEGGGVKTSEKKVASLSDVEEIGLSGLFSCFSSVCCFLSRVECNVVVFRGLRLLVVVVAAAWFIFEEDRWRTLWRRLASYRAGYLRFNF